MQDFAGGGDAFMNFIAQRARDQRLMFAEIQIVGFRPIDPADLINVAEAGRDDERGARARAFQHGVNRNRRSMQEQRRIAENRIGPGDAVVDSVNEPLGCGQCFAEAKRPRALVEYRYIREGATDISGNTRTRRRRDVLANRQVILPVSALEWRRSLTGGNPVTSQR